LAGAPAAAKDTALVFVSNEKTNNIVVIDAATFKIVKDIKTCRRPRDLHFSADHAKLYVACGDDDLIQILDVVKLAVVGKIKTGPSPEAFGIDEKRGRLYVSEEEASALAVIDMASDRIVQEVPTGAEPEGVLVADDGNTVYLTSEAGDLVHEVAADGARRRGRYHRSGEIRHHRQGRVSATGHAQVRRDAGRHRHEQGRQDRLRGAWPCRARGGGRHAGAQSR
jgi:DNA-binding beta-propeller fold protein YncE